MGPTPPHRWYEDALGGGLPMGTGFLVLFLRQRSGWRAGCVQMAIGGPIVCAAFAWVAPLRVALSVLGAVAMNVVLALNHRPGRYAAF